ncbi:MAG: hypothetical protein GX126_05950, partial [Bacteroidales bacterium]|nr:hypothetical protein [Bacteroidales bacterium]
MYYKLDQRRFAQELNTGVSNMYYKLDQRRFASTEGFPELSGEHLEDWVYWAMIDDVRFDSTDQELENLCDEYE